MIAFARPHRARLVSRRQVTAPSTPAWHAGFLRLLPDIFRQVRFAFRRLTSERREEAVQEALANALLAYRRLHQLGKAELAYASPLAQYAVRQVCDGRQIACPLNTRDVLSSRAQRKLGFKVATLHHADEAAGIWNELLVEDRSCTPAELAASRLDFGAWLKRLPEAKRKVAATLATGETTRGAAKKFQLTPGRISQLRRELAVNWREFQREAPPAAGATR